MIAAAALVAAQSRAATPPTIAGQPVQGQTLTAVDPAGAEPLDKHQWQRCASPGASCSSWQTVSGPHQTTYVLSAADVGYLIRVRGQYVSEGETWAASAPVGPVTASSPPPPPPTPPPPPDPPPPPPDPDTPEPQGPSGLEPAVANESANLFGIEGTVYVKEPGGDWVLLTDPLHVPLNVKIDATNGVVGVVTAENEAGTQQTVRFWGATFVLTQVTKGKLLTNAEIAGGGFEGASARQIAERGRRGRRGLWGRGRCKCRTEGSHSAGTVKGTWWLTLDKKKKTKTKVKRGKVKVKNFASGEKVLVRAGETYVAHAND
jgi:hypothetical protein